MEKKFKWPGCTAKKRLKQARLNQIKSDEMNNALLQESLEERYNLKKKGMTVVVEELKQRVLAKSKTIRRYESRIEQYRQNRMFHSNQKRLFEKLDNMDTENTMIPGAEESRTFWASIWDNPVNHNSNADWLKDVESKLAGVQKQNDLVITPAIVTKQLKNMANWKAPGPNSLQGFWLKSFTPCIERIALQLQDCLVTYKVPEWFTRGRTTLILKEKEKRNAAPNFRPITCLLLMWKVFNGVMEKELYKHQQENNLSPDEQKGCRRRSRGTKD